MSYGLLIERSLLSSIFFDPSIYEEIASTLKPSDFELPIHSLIFQEMGILYSTSTPINEQIIAQRLSKHKDFNEEYLIEIVSINPIIDVKYYVKYVKDGAIKRDLHKLSLEIKDLTSKEDLASQDVIDEIQSKLYKITEQSDSRGFRESGEIIASLLNQIKEQKARGNSYLVGIDTGFHDLNKMTTGFNEGDLIILAARPAMGKTAFALNIVSAVLKNGFGVAFFSLEMPAEQLMMRLLSMKTSISLQNIRVGNLTDDEYHRLADGTDLYSKYKLFVDDDSSLNINQLRTKLRKLKSQHKELKLAVIDYLQIMSANSTMDRNLAIGEISRGLKILARELKIPIIALSQLNRSLEKRVDRRPIMSDLRESGSIEQDADMILFIYRDDVYKLKDEKEKAKNEQGKNRTQFHEKNEETAEIIIGKQRNGPTGTIELLFQKNWTRFTDFTSSMEVTYNGVSVDDIKRSKFIKNGDEVKDIENPPFTL